MWRSYLLSSRKKMITCCWTQWAGHWGMALHKKIRCGNGCDANIKSNVFPSSHHYDITISMVTATQSNKNQTHNNSIAALSSILINHTWIHYNYSSTCASPSSWSMNIMLIWRQRTVSSGWDASETINHLVDHRCTSKIGVVVFPCNTPYLFVRQWNRWLMNPQRLSI